MASMGGGGGGVNSPILILSCRTVIHVLLGSNDLDGKITP